MDDVSRRRVIRLESLDAAIVLHLNIKLETQLGRSNCISHIKLFLLHSVTLPFTLERSKVNVL